MKRQYMGFDDYSVYPVLIVDDEEDFLRIFEGLGDLFHLHIESFPSEALIHIQRCSYCVVISDNKMRYDPEMPEDEWAGVNFLRNVKLIDSHPLRVLVTGWSKEGIRPSLSSEADVNIVIDKLEVLTDKEWGDTLRKIIDIHKKVH